MKSLYAGILLAALFVSSCATLHYPSAVNTPLFKEKGESNLQADVNLSSITAKGAHAFSNHFGLAGSVNFWGWSYTFLSSAEQGIGLQVHCLPGYFAPLGKHWLFEVYGGYGLGMMDTETYSGFNDHQIILQPSVGLRRERFEMSISIRATEHIVTDFTYDPALSNPTPQAGLFLDPALTFRMGGESLKASTQIGMSIATDDNFELEYRGLFLINFGVHYRFKKRSGVTDAQAW